MISCGVYMDVLYVLECVLESRLSILGSADRVKVPHNLRQPVQQTVYVLYDLVLK